jgi:hypothetical protein
MGAADMDTECLNRGGMLCIDDGRGRSIQVREGVIWLTQERDARDIFLFPGDSFRLDHPGRAIVQAIDVSTFTLTAAQPEPGPWARLVASHRKAPVLVTGQR